MEVDRQREDEQVRIADRNAGLRNDGGQRAAGSIRAVPAILPLGEQVVPFLPRAGNIKRRLLEDGIVATHLAQHADLVAVVQVAAHAEQIRAHGETQTVEFGARADARQHEQLRGVEGAAAQDDLVARVHLPRLQIRRRGLRGMPARTGRSARPWPVVTGPACLVDAVPGEVFDACRAVAVEENPGGKTVQLNREQVRMLSHHRLETFAAAVALAFADRDGNECHALVAALNRIEGIGIAGEGNIPGDAVPVTSRLFHRGDDLKEHGLAPADIGPGPGGTQPAVIAVPGSRVAIGRSITR